MKRVALLLTLVILLGGINTTYAQLSKKEQKEWKKRLRRTSPDQFKRMYDENNAVKEDLTSLQVQVNSLKSAVNEKDAKIAELTDELRRSESVVNDAKRSAAQALQEAEQMKRTSNQIPSKGVFFRVQIGAFRNKDLSKYFDNHDNFGGEIDEDGMQRITLGIFNDYWEADTFKKYLREMGVSDAWIVPYKDGARVTMKDVLEGAVQ
ncbi:MAG: Ezrin/radixin/moesin family protein [Cyclobacteriaceae bacterium]|nr:Ezrin/radixin/moesin family protein [Cyclobacteriaceae bacterium]